MAQAEEKDIPPAQFNFEDELTLKCLGHAACYMLSRSDSCHVVMINLCYCFFFFFFFFFFLTCLFYDHFFFLNTCIFDRFISNLFNYSICLFIDFFFFFSCREQAKKNKRTADKLLDVILSIFFFLSSVNNLNIRTHSHKDIYKRSINKK